MLVVRFICTHTLPISFSFRQFQGMAKFLVWSRTCDVTARRGEPARVTFNGCGTCGVACADLVIAKFGIEEMVWQACHSYVIAYLNRDERSRFEYFFLRSSSCESSSWDEGT